MLERKKKREREGGRKGERGDGGREERERERMEGRKEEKERRKVRRENLGGTFMLLSQRIIFGDIFFVSQ